jgi:acetyl-CoA synthetase
VVFKRTGSPTQMHAPRDKWWDDVIRRQGKTCEPVWVNAEHPLFVLYTSGSTGKPKGVQHSTGGYLLWSMLTMQWVFDHKSNDVFWCTADVGWVTGHTYACYGPLAGRCDGNHLRGYPDVSGRGPLLEDDSGSQGLDLLHGAHCNSFA